MIFKSTFVKFLAIIIVVDACFVRESHADVHQRQAMPVRFVLARRPVPRAVRFARRDPNLSTGALPAEMTEQQFKDLWLPWVDIGAAASAAATTANVKGRIVLLFKPAEDYLFELLSLANQTDTMRKLAKLKDKIDAAVGGAGPRA